MTVAVRRLAVCWVFSLVLACWATSTSDAYSLAPGGSSSGPFVGSLVVAGEGLLDEGAQEQAVADAMQSSPEAVVSREESRTKYEHENPQQAAKTAGEAFPTFINESAGGPPQLPADQKILGFESAEVAQIDRGDNEPAVIESTLPMAMEVSGGNWDPINLALHEADSEFEPVAPLIPVRIPKRLGEGAQLSSTGVSVTPVTGQGAALGGSEGESDGATVFFANTQTDSDTVLKPSTYGLEATTILRSVQSPQQLYYRVGLPEGASLAQTPAGSETVRVVKEGATLATISAPEARDVAGSPVPASMSVSGDTLVVTVDEGSGSWDFPILVDPYWQVTETVTPGNWEFHEFSGYTYGKSTGELWMKHTGSFPSSDYAAWSAFTKGYTEIYEVNIRDDLYPTYSGSETGYKESSFPFMSATIEILSLGNEILNTTSLSGIPYKQEAHVCVSPTCQPDQIEEGPNMLHAGNGERFEVTTVEPSKAGNEPPFGGSASWLSTAIAEARGRHSTVNYNVISPELTYENAEKKSVTTSNVRYFTGGGWLGPAAGAFELTASDGGLGVAETKVEYDSTSGWELFGGTNYQTNSGCIGVQCATTEKQVFSYEGLANSAGKHLPSGEDLVRIAARSPMPYTTSSEYGEGEAIFKVDATPPHELKLTGLGGSGENLELGEAEAHLKVEATDGEGTTPSSGIKEISIEIDGHEIGQAGGSCSPGPCTGSSEWLLNGAELGVGSHILTVVATDNAGNKAEPRTYHLTVYHASPIAMGPGSVNPESGDFAVGASDVDLSGSFGSLSVTRHYDSRNPTEGAEGSLGPQWTIGLGSVAELELLPEGSAMILGPEGLTLFAAKQGGGFEAPTGDANLTLTSAEYESKPAYLLKNEGQGTTTVFTLPKGAKLWMATAAKGPFPTDTITDAYKTVEAEGKVTIEPTLELAPHPEASCEPSQLEKLEIAARGCRALLFVYGTEDKAKGENRSEWNEYKNQLKEVLAVAYNPATKAMAKTPVAAYEYDAKGRLRAEWNPEIKPALKTTYGYDAEGHVTAIIPPGQQSWAVTYGTIPDDPSTGRLLKVTRAPAAAPLWDGELAKNTAVPQVSGTPMVGVRLAASNGVWSNEPIAYGYQWEQCPQEGECVPIPGATNPNYTPVSENTHRELRIRVTAVNGGGSVAAYVKTVAVEPAGSGYVEGEHKPPQPGATIEYGVPLEGTAAPYQMGTNPSSGKPEPEQWAQKDDPVEAAAVFPASKPMGWPVTTGVEYAGATTYYMDSQARTVNVANPSGGISTREYNAENAVERSLGADNRATALKEANPTEAAQLLSTKSTYSEGRLTQTWGPEHKVRLPVGKNESNEEVLARNHEMLFYDEGQPATGETYDLVTKTVDGAETVPGQEEFDRRTTETFYSGQSNLGWKLRKPTSITVDPGGLNLTSTTKYEESGAVVETQKPAGGGKDAKVPPAYSAQFGAKGSASGQLEKPTYDAIDAHGDVWVTEYGSNRVSEFSASGSFIETVGWGVSNGEAKLEVCTSSCKAGIAGAGKGELEEPTGIAIAGGDIYIVDTGNSRVEVLNEKAEYVTQWGSVGTAAGKFKTPLAIAISASDDVWVGDSLNRRLQEFTASGTFIEAVGWGVSNGKEEYEVCKSGCQAGTKGTGNGQFASTWGLTFARTASGGTNLYVTDTGNNRVEEINEKSEYAGQFGTKGAGNGQLNAPVGIATSPSTGSLYVTDTGNNRVQVFTTAGEYLTQFGTEGSGNGQLDFPEGSTINSSGEIYVVDDLNHRVERWAPTIAGNEGAHDTKTVYYTAKGEAEVAACREHIEWVGLVCETMPAAQPGITGLPELPVTKYSYNMWNQAETVTEAFGSTTRTKTTTFDGAGRPLTTEETSSVDTALPKVTDAYNEHNGALETQSTTVGTTTKTITSHYNALGQLESYTDAGNNTARFSYNADEQVTEIRDSSEEGKGKQTYSYNETTGELEALSDSAAGTFGATYDAAGRITSESYPNGMAAYYTYNSVGATTKVEYKKLSYCTEEKEKCVWFKDTITPSIHGETLKQSSTLSEEPDYTYDTAGRLTAVQEVPAGEGCKTRTYTYDEDGNRASETAREPGTGGKCAIEGGSTEWHTYDTDDELTDPGVTYEGFGNTTKLPAADAGAASLTSSYYVDGQVKEQGQGGETIEYQLDPEERTLETISSGNTAATVVDHYDAPGSAVAWSSEPATGAWTRDIPGPGGELAAIETNTKAPVLQLHDLQDNIVATASISEKETKLLSKYNSTEFGVPSSKESPPPYAWLGAAGVSSALPSGTITQDGNTYVPETGRKLQTEAVDLPLPVLTVTAFNGGGPSWIGRSDEEASAMRVAQAEEAREAAAAANSPAACSEEGEGCESDPCTSIYENERLGLPGDEDFASAWVTVEWCYTARRVVSASVKNKGYHDNTPTWADAYEIHFKEWLERAESRYGDDYEISRIAKFLWAPEALLGDFVPSSFVLPWAYIFIEINFLLGPGGYEFASTRYRCEGDGISFLNLCAK